MSLPVMTPEQRAEALRKAADARKARAGALDEIRKGTATLPAVLADENSPLQRAKVRQVLRAIPGVGGVTADKVMAEVGIDPSRRVAGLGKNQRAALAEHFAA
jgi:predicted flap endonuclease-1-like 5' DNA nuclease